MSAHPMLIEDGEVVFNRQHAPKQWIVPGVLTYGLAALSARPKAGKSGVMLSIAIAVATGDRPLGTETVDAGDVLYIDAENGPEVNQDRMRAMFPGDNRPTFSRLKFAFDPPRLDKGLMVGLEQWRQESSNPRLVVIDIYAKVKPAGNSRKMAPDADNDALVPLHRWANEHRIAVVLLLHNRKGPLDPDDILGSVVGSSALTGTPDVVMIMVRRSTGEISLHATGRKLPTDSHLALIRDGGWYRSLGDADTVAMSSQRRAIIAAIRDHGRLSPQEIADITDMVTRNVSGLLFSMAKDKKVVRHGGGRYTSYSLPNEEKGGNGGNAGEVAPEKVKAGNDFPADSSVTASITDSAEGEDRERSSVTDRDSGNGAVTEESPYPTKEITSSVTVTDENSPPSMRMVKSNGVEITEKEFYLLNWLVGFGGTATLRQAQQRCSNVIDGEQRGLTGEEIRKVAPDLATRGLITIHTGNTYATTDLGTEAIKGKTLF